MRGDVLDRLADKFTVGDGCWLWRAGMTAGYGQFAVSRRRRSALAHRVVYELLVGPVPDGLELDHLCKTKACVRPSHLEPVTHQENMRRSESPHSRKTHCPHGHPYSGDNLVLKRGQRVCRACKIEGQRRIRERNRRCS